MLTHGFLVKISKRAKNKSEIRFIRPIAVARCSVGTPIMEIEL